MNEFQEQILEHYHNPRNFFKPNWTPTKSAKLQNLSCGDEIELFLLIENNKVKDVSFQGEGCSIALASASLLTEQIKNKSLKFLKKYTIEKLLSLIGIPLTPSRTKCATLSFETLTETLK